MRTNVQIKEVANALYSGALNSFENFDRKAELKGIASKDTDTVTGIISKIVTDIETIIKGQRVDDISFPSFISRVTVSADTIKKVTISLRSKLKADYKFTRTISIDIDEDIVSPIATFYVNSLLEMYYLDCANENVKELNETIKAIQVENNIPYSISFVASDEATTVVAAISDNALILNADISEAHDISSLGIFYSGDEYNELVKEKAIAGLVDEMKSAQTPVQFLKSNNNLIKKVTGVSTKKRASSLLREIYHRKAENLNAVKQGVGYYNSKTTVNGEEVEVFALVEKAEDGTKTVVLSPFNVKTLEKVDVDVLAEIA